MKELCCRRTRQNLLPSLCLFQHPSLDVYGLLVVYKEYNLRVIGSASLPACVWMQWMSSLPVACIDAHGYPQLWCPRFTSHPLCFLMIFRCCCCQKLWPGRRLQMHVFIPLWGLLALSQAHVNVWHNSGQFWGRILTMFFSYLGIFSDLFLLICAGDYDGICSQVPKRTWGKVAKNTKKNCCSFCHWCVPKADMIIF